VVVLIGAGSLVPKVYSIVRCKHPNSGRAFLADNVSYVTAATNDVDQDGAIQFPETA
jgi:hypothetical protein